MANDASPSVQGGAPISVASNPVVSNSMSSSAIASKENPVLLIDILGRWIKMPLYPLALYFTLFSLAFWNNLDIPTGDRTADNIGASPQAIIKMGFILMGLWLGVWGWWRSPKVRQLVGSVPGYALFFLGIWQFLSAIQSDVVSLNLALAGVASYWGALLVVMAGVAYLGPRQVVYCLTAGMATFALGSILFYFISPSNAMFTEVMDLTNKVARFGGMGHPNSLGRMTFLVGLMLFSLGLDKRLDWRIALPLTALCFMEGAATLSRTPMVAGFFGMIAMVVPKIGRERAILWTGVAGGCGVLLVILLEFTIGTTSISQKILDKGTKTGKVEELTTMTGRTEIWEFAWELAKEKPVFGHGPGATPILMEKKSGHAHNALLDPTVNLGLPAGFAILVVFLWQAYCCFVEPNSMLRSGVAFLVAAGISERLLFGTIPDSISYFWLAFAFWGVLPERALTVPPPPDVPQEANPQNRIDSQG